MAKLSDAFPSKYLKADVDVPDEGTLVLTVRDADFEMLGQGDDAERKLILFFEEVEKGLVLNKTNATTITNLLKSDDTDDWVGQKIALFSADVQYGTKMMRGIRVSTKAPKAAPAPARQAAPAKPRVAAPPPADDDDEDVPFARALDFGPAECETDRLFGHRGY